MRERKYRVWDKKDSRWVSCNVVVDYSGVLFWVFGYEIKVIDDPGRYDVQYSTGRKDEAGTEIYQGDILSGDYPDEVIWDKDREQWMLNNHNDPDDTLWEILKLNKPRIIGNIHENPELLEAK